VVKKVKLVVKYRTLIQTMASPGVGEDEWRRHEYGEGSIVAGIGVDVDISPPNTVRVDKAQKEELAGMSNELKRKLRELQRSNWGRSQN
jgi:hypothetical protein